MKNFIQRGDTVTLVAPYALASSGLGVKVGSIVGVAVAAASSGADVEVALTGVFDVKKTSAQAWTVGALVYWDDSAKEFTTTSTSNTLAGVAVAAAANPTATGRVRLNGHFG
jgi:predicted RecA/RadA family phage recombinase